MNPLAHFAKAPTAPEPGSRPATGHEILKAFGKLLVAFELFDDPHHEARIALLAESVQDQPLWAIRKAVDDFAFGRVPRKRDVFPKPYEFAPHVVRIGEAARVRTAEAANDATAAGGGRAYAYSAPRSPIVERNCTRDFAWRLVEQGFQPSGSIWCPGTYRVSAEHGDLYAPDPAWKGPALILTREEAEALGTSH